MKKDPTSKKELEELSPFLSKLKKEEGYQVPFNYFEVLPDQIMEQVTKEQTPIAEPSSKETPPWSLGAWLSNLLQPRYALALASLVLMIFAGTFLADFSTSDPISSDQLMASISPDEARSYVQSNIEDFELELLGEDLEMINEKTDFMEFDQQELQQYIEDQGLEDIDTQSLEELL